MCNNSHEEVHRQIVRWLEEKVIGLELCPFARQPWLKGRVLIDVLGLNELAIGEGGEEKPDAFLEKFLETLHRLQQQPAEELETVLLVLANGYQSFDDYLGLLNQLNELIVLGGWEGQFQIASFHPCYQFAGTRKNARENYTNRSPFPIIHVLREDSVEKALSLYPNAEDIPARNIERLEAMSENEFLKLFSR